MKANELLEKSEERFQLYASADYLSELYYDDFSDTLKSKTDEIDVTLVTDNSVKSAYFLGQMKWLSHSDKIADEQNLPCFMISDGKEVLITFHEKDGGDDEKKKCRTAAIWTNYSALVNTLQVLFCKLTKKLDPFSLFVIHKCFVACCHQICDLLGSY